jgi:hypothetical protein
MTMTKKHFEQLAYLIATSPFDTEFDRTQAACIVSDVAAASNPNFDRGRFMWAAGIGRAFCIKPDQEEKVAA